MVLMYVGINWHCQKFESPFPLPPRGSMPPHRGTLRTNRPISMKFGPNGSYVYMQESTGIVKNSKHLLPPQRGSMPPHRGTFRTNGPISMKFGTNGIDWHCQKFETPLAMGSSTHYHLGLTTNSRCRCALTTRCGTPFFGWLWTGTCQKSRPRSRSQ